MSGKPLSYIYFASKFLSRDRLTTIFQFVSLVFFFLTWHVAFYFGFVDGIFKTELSRLLFVLAIGVTICNLALYIVKLQRRTADLGIIQAMGATRLQGARLILLEHLIQISAAALISLAIVFIVPWQTLKVQDFTGTNNYLLFIYTYLGGTFLFLFIILVVTSMFNRQDPYRAIRRGR